MGGWDTLGMRMAALPRRAHWARWNRWSWKQTGECRGAAAPHPPEGEGMVTSGTQGAPAPAGAETRRIMCRRFLASFVIIVEVGTKQNGNQLRETSFRGGVSGSRVSMSAPKCPVETRVTPCACRPACGGAVSGRSRRHVSDPCLRGKPGCPVLTVLAVTSEASTRTQTSARRQRLDGEETGP